METICKSCHKKFHTKLSILQKGKGKFCSRACYGNYLKNTEIKRFDLVKWKKENPELAKGVERKRLEKVIGHIPWNKGRKTGIIPPNAWKKGQNLGEKHPNWKGGKWHWAKRKTLERDDYTCQICGLKEPEIMETAHKQRKNNYSDYYQSEKRAYLVHNPNDLITLCPNCHRKYDKGLIELSRI